MKLWKTIERKFQNETQKNSEFSLSVFRIWFWEFPKQQIHFYKNATESTTRLSYTYIGCVTLLVYTILYRYFFLFDSLHFFPCLFFFIFFIFLFLHHYFVLNRLVAIRISHKYLLLGFSNFFTKSNKFLYFFALFLSWHFISRFCCCFRFIFFVLFRFDRVFFPSTYECYVYPSLYFPFFRCVHVSNFPFFYLVFSSPARFHISCGKRILTINSYACTITICFVVYYIYKYTKTIYYNGKSAQIRILYELSEKATTPTVT